MTIKINTDEEKTYIVMGCPNSATSFISKALEKLGVSMGNKKAGWYQPFYEDPDFLNLNKKMIQFSMRMQHGICKRTLYIHIQF